ncbi:MAG TPA: ATP-binding protein [Nitratidesulfovibrio sp.]|nr:ATP-binding protein [Nitratidesulfovibrio sp.]
MLFAPKINPRIVTKATKNIIEKPTIAILELIANSWDAGATRVEIIIPSSQSVPFSITDNGHGMTLEDFQNHWLEVGYNRLIDQGDTVSVRLHDEELHRKAFGRNGIGKFAIFCFADKFMLSTSSNGKETRCTISKNIATSLFDINDVNEIDSIKTGTTIKTLEPTGVRLNEQHIISEIAQRFVFDENFEIIINGKKLTHDDIDSKLIQEETLHIDEENTIKITIITRKETDQTLRFSGIGWRVHGRLVGDPSWALIDEDRLLDGRTTQARRHAVIVDASCLASAVNEDWTNFDTTDPVYIKASEIVSNTVSSFISSLNKDSRNQRITIIKERTRDNLSKLGEISKLKIENFITDIVHKCPSIKEKDFENIVKSLATLETSSGKYGIIEKLAALTGEEWDKLKDVISDWTVTMAKDALDEIKGRLLLIDELRRLTEDVTTLEVQELQPIMEKCLWIFGPEFESIEYSPNQAIATCFQKLMGKRTPVKTSRNRPDFTILPDSAVSFHAAPSYGDDYAENGIGSLVILELKAPSIAIGRDEKHQPSKYYDEFKATGLVSSETRVTAFVLGSKTQKTLQMDPLREGNLTTNIMLFPTLLQRAESRLLNLREKVKTAPCLSKPILTAVTQSK